ncbi:hypothetical protein BKA62DRAFT_711413, partial [Auriculariales sp. MPI-PUGE-AT-0066]
MLRLLCVVSLGSLARAAFTQAACRNNDCIQQNHREMWCYHPSPDSETLIPCLDDGLKALAHAHAEPRSLRSLFGSAAYPSSVAYYDSDSLSYIGGGGMGLAEFPASAKVVACLSGVRAGSEEVITTCYRVSGDNDFSYHAHADSCTIKHQNSDKVVRDGCCGPPRSNCPSSGGFLGLTCRFGTNSRS